MMRRPGVNFEEVRQAVAKLTAERRPVSTRAVRTEIGAGSMYTILHHLHRVNARDI